MYRKHIIDISYLFTMLLSYNMDYSMSINVINISN